MQPLSHPGSSGSKASGAPPARSAAQRCARPFPGAPAQRASWGWFLGHPVLLLELPRCLPAPGSPSWGCYPWPEPPAPPIRRERAEGPSDPFAGCLPPACSHSDGGCYLRNSQCVFKNRQSQGKYLLSNLLFTKQGREPTIRAPRGWGPACRIGLCCTSLRTSLFIAM